MRPLWDLIEDLGDSYRVLGERVSNVIADGQSVKVSLADADQPEVITFVDPDGNVRRMRPLYDSRHREILDFVELEGE